MNSDSGLIGRLETVPIKQVFKHEEHQFTPWLEQHIDALAERLGMELTVVQREKAVGDFSVDLMCEDAEGKAVIIENQLERTNHDHLGKLLTYLVNLDASTAIWVTPEPRPEHEKVIDWLNEATGADISFYLVKVEAIRIGDSPFAPLFTPLVSPDAQAKEIGEKKKEWAERHRDYVAFWTGLLEKSKPKTTLFANINPGRRFWLGTGAGRSGVSFNYIVLEDRSSVELYINYDRDTGSKNKVIFDALYSHKDEIEGEVGAHLDWQRLDDKVASRISLRFTDGGLANPEAWPSIQYKMIDAMIILDKALRPRLAQIEV
ncbi:MAG: DUF4268 domain-containing protein [candidate division WOR-3 bacterium]|nr:DUF4268 domain-containing protein [candidate division WOR-3 bacterium]